MENRLKFSIIVPYLRGWRGHEPILRAINSCLTQSEMAFEIRVVANMPDPLMERAVMALKDSRIAFECVGKVGVNAARNLGARSSSGEFFLFLDDDCTLPTSNFLLEIQRLFLSHPEYSALGGGYESPSNAAWLVHGYNAMASAWVLAGAQPGTGGLSRVVNLLGGNLCMRRKIFEGMAFDESYVSGGDETEFLRRLRARGKELGYAPSLAVTHFADSSVAGLVGRAWRQGRARKNKGIASPAFRSYSFLKALWKEPSLLPFSLLHFPVLYLAEKAPKLSRTVRGVG